ncbi:histamine N-methyltransferase B-like [Ptychodera flava]|uniref:histamine N-methyltransferase B-like n=1 Tax=Ptychodera flava TaxID=63121 RepID=UPI00396A3121
MDGEGKVDSHYVASNHQHYKRIYQWYEKLTDRIEKVHRYCSETFPDIAIGNFARNQERDETEHPEVFRYFGVGSGSGDSDIAILTQLSKRLPRIEATITEPSDKMIANFKLAISECGNDALQKIKFTWNQATIEEYMKMPQDTKFHCIFLCGVLAYFKDVDQVVQYLYSVLAENGTILIVTESGNETNIFYEVWYPGRFPSINEQIAIPDNVVASFERCGGKVRSSNLECILDGSTLVDEESESGSLLLDLLTGVVDCRKTAPPEFLRQFLDFISDSNVSFKQEGKFLLKNDRVLIIVQK